MSLAVYLNFPGTAREAIAFYEQVFGVSAGMTMSFGDGPEHPDFPMPDEVKSRIMHSRLLINGDWIMFSDTWDDSQFVEGNNFTIAYFGNDTAQLTDIFNKLAEGGTILQPLQETAWSPLYGQVTDKFGVGWQINYEESLA